MGFGFYHYNRLPIPKVSRQVPVASNIAKAIRDLRELFPGDGVVITSKEVLESYRASKYTNYTGSEKATPHSVIVFPSSTEDVVRIVKVARKWNIPMVPCGSNTGLEGHTANVSSHFLVLVRPSNRISFKITVSA